MNSTTTAPQGGSSPSPLFAIGQRIRFWHGKRRVSGIIYDVGPTMYCVTVCFGRNHLNLGVDHDQASMANDEMTSPRETTTNTQKDEH